MNALHIVLDVFGIINLSNVLLLALYVVQFVVQSVEYHSESVCTLHRQHCCCVLPGYSYQPSSLANPRTNVTHYMYFSSLVLLCSLHWDDVVALCDTNSSVIAILVLCDWWVCVCVFSPTDSVSNGNISCSVMLAVVVGMQSMAVFLLQCIRSWTLSSLRL